MDYEKFRARTRKGVLGCNKKLANSEWHVRICSTALNNLVRNEAMRVLKSGLSGSMLAHKTKDYQRLSYYALLCDPKGNARVCGVFHLQKDLALISLFVTEPSFQFQGLGRVLNAFLVKHCHEHDLRIAVLANPEAIPFWTHKTVGYRSMYTRELSKFGLKGTRNGDPTPTRKRLGARHTPKRDIMYELIHKGSYASILTIALKNWKTRATKSSLKKLSLRRSTRGLMKKEKKSAKSEKNKKIKKRAVKQKGKRRATLKKKNQKDMVKAKKRTRRKIPKKVKKQNFQQEK